MDNNSILHSDIIANLFENQKPDIDTYNFTYKVNQAKMSIVFLNMVRYAEDIEKLIDELNEAIKDFPPFCPEEKTAIKKKALT